MSIKVKSQKELKKWKDKSLGQQVEAEFGVDIAKTFIQMSKKINTLEADVKKLKRYEDKQASKAFAKAISLEGQVASILLRLRNVEELIHSYLTEEDSDVAMAEDSVQVRESDCKAR